MSQYAIIASSQLEPGLILVPERYDPRREIYTGVQTIIADVTDLISDQVVPGKGNQGYYLVLDTTDAKQGIIYINKTLVKEDSFASVKKLIQPGDVIISRLRPYLHQVAYCDLGIFNTFKQELNIICSTEFFVLRSKNEQSIAFLVPYLLSQPVQAILAASQEGGHHPRFTQTTLQRIKIPDCVLKNRDSISSTVETAIHSVRKSTETIKDLVRELSQL
jgi:Type I restriction modification DNA specificity domain